MMKKTFCLVFFLALIAHIVAVPDDKGNEDAVKKATEEEKKKEGELGHVADTANATATKAVHAAKKGTHGTHPHAKDCKKQPGLVSGAIETVDDIGKKAVDTGVHAMADFFKLFGL